MNTFWKEFKNTDFGPKNGPFTHPNLDIRKIFQKNPKQSFKLFFNACHQVQLYKNLIKRFWEKLKTINFDPKMAHLLQFFLKKGLRYFLVFIKS